jgi:hypothetical protein
VIEHCRALEERYRGERLCLAARDARMPVEPRSPGSVRPGVGVGTADQVGWRGGSSAPAAGG